MLHTRVHYTLRANRYHIGHGRSTLPLYTAIRQRLQYNSTRNYSTTLPEITVQLYPKASTTTRNRTTLPEIAYNSARNRTTLPEIMQLYPKSHNSARNRTCSTMEGTRVQYALRASAHRST
eukprot:3266646-Rhodomonas_salina.1